MIPDPIHWYINDVPDDCDPVWIYDGADYAVLRVAAREADEEAGMDGYQAKELALLILRALGARWPIC